MPPRAQSEKARKAAIRNFNNLRMKGALGTLEYMRSQYLDEFGHLQTAVRELKAFCAATFKPSKKDIEGCKCEDPDKWEHVKDSYDGNMELYRCKYCGKELLK